MNTKSFRWGHNELDEPTFTNPLMYAAVRSRQSIPDRYGDLLVAEGVVTRQHLDDVLAEHTTRGAGAHGGTHNRPLHTCCQPYMV